MTFCHPCEVHKLQIPSSILPPNNRESGERGTAKPRAHKWGSVEGCFSWGTCLLCWNLFSKTVRSWPPTLWHSSVLKRMPIHCVSSLFWKAIAQSPHFYIVHNALCQSLINMKSHSQRLKTKCQSVKTSWPLWASHWLTLNSSMTLRSLICH